MSVRLMNPSRSRRRAPSSASRRDTPTVASAVRWPLVPPLRLDAGRGAAPTSRPAGGRRASLELSAEGGVFGNDLLIPLAFHGGLRYRRDAPDRFGVFQVRVDRGDHDAGLDRDEVDADERNADPRVDDNPLVEDSIEDVDETCAACSAFNGHYSLLRTHPDCGRRLPRQRRGPAARQRQDPPLERANLLFQFLVFGRQRLLAGREM